MDIDDFAMIYPVFQICGDRGILPSLRLPREYKDLVKHFYEQGRKEDVEDYVNKLKEVWKRKGLEVEPRLSWDDEKGLIHIVVGTAIGLDLEDNFGWPNYAEHNLGGERAIMAAMIVTYYISELIKSEQSEKHKNKGNNITK